MGKHVWRKAGGKIVKIPVNIYIYIFFFFGGGGMGRWEEGGGGGPKHPCVLFQYLQVFTYLHNISASFSPYIVGRVVQCIIILLIGYLFLGG